MDLSDLVNDGGAIDDDEDEDENEDEDEDEDEIENRATRKISVSCRDGRNLLTRL
jgi:hypothetical protein